MLRAPPRPPDPELVARARSSGRATPEPPRRGLSSVHRRRLLVVGASVAGVAAVLVVVLFLLVPSLTRRKVVAEGARRGVDVTVGSVRPGFFTVTLRDVAIKPRGIEGVDGRLDEVRVDLSAGFAVREVVAHGGDVSLDGEPDVLVEKLRSLRKGDPQAAAAASAPKTPLSVDGVTAHWKVPSGGALEATGVGLSRDGNGTKIVAAHATAKLGRDSVDVEGGEVVLGEGGQPVRVAARALSLGHESAREVTAAPPPTMTAEPAPPPLPVAVPPPPKKGRVAKTVAAAPPAPPPPEEPVLPRVDLRVARAKIGTLAAAVAPRIPDGGAVDIGALTAKVDVGGEALTFGPGAFKLTRHGDRVALSFATEKEKDAPGATPLSIDADLPLAGGDVVARMSGGPVSLAVLGVKEGTKGLQDVGRGTVAGKGQVVLAAAGDSLTFDGELKLHAISVKQARLSPEPIRGLDFGVAARGVFEPSGKLRVDDAQIDMGALHVKTHGTIEESPAHFGVSLAIDVTPAACQALVDSTPQGLLPIVRSMRMSGTFGASARVAFDTRAIDKLALEYQVDDRCRIEEVPSELSRDRFSSGFSYRTYRPDGTPRESHTGPGTSNWTDLDDISPFVVAALLTTEDGAFYKHHGFNHSAIRNSVQANLKARRFVRGASTITMQLAKNLFLSREKTLSRKIEEVVLTAYLEQAFRKDDMMELYLNVVEFGPDVYGITQAAEHYFGRKPEELNLPESFFLASLLPSPIRYGKLRDKGQVSEGWMHHLRTLMEISAKYKKISRAELATGLEESIVFVRAGDPRPEPRKPVRATRPDPYEDDTGWQPLE